MARIKTDYVNGGYTFAVDWELVSQDVANNTSQVKAVVKLISNGASYTINSSAAKSLKLTINGVDYTTTVNAGLTGNQTKTLFTKTVTVQHNADGSKNCAISATLGIQVTLSGVYYANFTASGSAALTAIPRASEIASLTENIVVNGTNKMTVNITRKSSAFTHSVRIKFGAYETTLTNVATQAEYVIPTSWLNAIPNSLSGTGTVFVTTYSGSTKIGSTVSKGYTLTVPTNAAPTFTTLGVQRIDNDVPASWGIYVQGHSQCAATITGASGIYGSTIKKYEIQIGDTKGSAATLTADLPNAGTVTIKGTVTDSRGRTFSRTATINVAAYKVPVLDSIALYRASQSGAENDEGTYIGGKIAYTFSAIGANVASTSIEYKLPTETQWTYAGSFANDQAFTLGGGNLNIDKSYDVRIGLADALGWIGKIETLATGFTTLDLLKGGKGIAFGKVAETPNLADFGFKARFRNGITVDGGITPDHLKNLKAITQEAEVGQYVRLLSFPFRMDNYNSYNITLAYSETIYGEINGFLDFHLRTIVNRFDVRKLQTRARTGTTLQSDFYADFKDGVCSIYWKPATEYARLKMTVFGWAAYENTEVDPSNVYTLDGTHVFGSIGSDFIRVTHTSGTASAPSGSESKDEPSSGSDFEMPVGSITQYAGRSIPYKWLKCDGRAISRTYFSELFEAIGTMYGEGDGSTTFNLPNLESRVPIGTSDSHALASVGGSETHTLTVDEMPSHTHVQNEHNHTQNSSGQCTIDSSGAHTHTVKLEYVKDAASGSAKNRVSAQGQASPSTTTTYDTTNSGSSHKHTVPNHTHTNKPATAVNQNTGGGEAHSIMQPFIALNYIIYVGK